MELQNRNGHWVILDLENNEVIPFGHGERGLADAVEFLNQLRMAELAAELAGFAH